MQAKLGVVARTRAALSAATAALRIMSWSPGDVGPELRQTLKAALSIGPAPAGLLKLWWPAYAQFAASCPSWVRRDRPREGSTGLAGSAEAANRPGYKARRRRQARQPVRHLVTSAAPSADRPSESRRPRSAGPLLLVPSERPVERVRREEMELVVKGDRPEALDRRHSLEGDG